MVTTKDTVLSMLLQSNGYISGEAVSSALGISRAAVNSAVKTLRSEGYVIGSSTRKGYILTEDPGLLNAGSLLSCLTPERMETIEVLEDVDSTNRYLKDLAYNGAPRGTVVIADHQSKGRGRLGRSFASPRGKGIYMSYLFRPSSSGYDISSLTSVAAVAVVRSVSEAAGIVPDIKWVNDILIGGRKCCGILTELSVESESGRIDSAVIGIGINVNEEESELPPEIAGTATSLYMASAHKVNRSHLASVLIKKLDELTDDSCDPASLTDEYRSRCVTIGSDVTVYNVHDDISGCRNGRALRVNDDFSLRVLFEDGHEEDLISGEVTTRISAH